MSKHDNSDLATRVEALEALLLEKHLIDAKTVDQIIEHYETNVGPLNGAKVVARAWVDPAYKQRLLKNATEAVAELGFGGPEGAHLRAVENTPDDPQRRRLYPVLLLPVARPRLAPELV